MLDQLVVGAAPGDAITRSALLLRDELAKLGPANVYAQFREPGVFDVVEPLHHLGNRPNADRPLIFHASMGSWPVYQALIGEPAIVLVYHNFSPPEAYIEHEPEVAGDLVRGRWELGQIRDRVVHAIAVSEYNAEELHALGYEGVDVVPPTPDVMRLNGQVPDPAMLTRITSWGADPLVLCVAQQLPHKRIERVLAAMAVLQQEHHPQARLAFVGVDRFPSYSRGLGLMARTLGLREPHFLGRVTDAELSALYLRADVFLTLSEHEGFCVPVVEAMAVGVPVVASRRAAIPSTVGDAGLLIDEPDDPALSAAAIDRVVRDDHLRTTLIGRGVMRAKLVAAPASLPQMLRSVLSAVPEVVPAATP